jgi:ABC-2 type transport system ATP-binding protein
MGEEKQENNVILRVNQLYKSFDTRPAIQGIDFVLKKGEVYGLLGPNGAGKSTTLKILSGLLSPDQGEIRVKGDLYHRDHVELKRLISYVPDEPYVYSKLTGEEHLDFYADLYQIPDAVRKEKFDFFFKYFEYESYRKELVETYSAGTKQKLLISQALMVKAEIILFDEPLTSIDPLVARKFINYIKKISKEGKVIIFATHILSLVQEVSTRIGVIVNGKIVTEGSIHDLLKISKDQGLEEFYFNTVTKYEKSD